MRFHMSYKKLDKDWWSDDQGDIYPGQVRDGVLYDKFKSDKDCKKQTPDGYFTKGDQVRLLFDVKSLGMNYDVPKGVYLFESYDSYDNTCFIVKKFDSPLHITYNVCLTDIKKIIILRNLKIKNDGNNKKRSSKKKKSGKKPQKPNQGN